MSSAPIPEEDIQDRTSDSEGSWGESAVRKTTGGSPDDDRDESEPYADDGRESLAAKVLESLGVNLANVRQEIEAIVGRGGQTVQQERRLTPRAKRVIELAFEEARQLDHHHVGTEHLLLGLIREGEGAAGDGSGD